MAEVLVLLFGKSVLKRNTGALRTSSGQNNPIHGSEPLSSSTPVGHGAGVWRVVAGKMYARGWPDLANGTKATLSRAWATDTVFNSVSN